MSGIPAWAVRGAKVVCVRAPETRSPSAASFPEPVKGGIYTLDGYCRIKSGEPFIGLVEMDEGCCFALELFRPATEPKSEVEDVALFKHHLDQRQGVDA